ncbi:uncharacterized protein E0L32_008938 [Thyridium curvatum]|uniref:Major facilitator superfamily (MFS) profile domain-containing protein n=1 Tax=Thyridium curvatum TaxID=1093900 RepID=A0A507AT87_9PEZI|nr:uncharacterized protein E0L32_008938 [Thyridium curvatum]TPX09916.1 hypothetical protein E0L32_008938 [Thyridium curvatum]
MTARGDARTRPHISLRSWTALVGASLALYSTVGFLNAFGVFQAHYQAHLLADRSASDISWIGSVSIFLLYLGAGFAGMLVDKFGPTKLLWFGSAVILIAVFMTSLCKEYWQFVLAQGVLLGAGMSLVFCTPLGVVMRHMPHRRGLAMGLTIGGASIGGVIWPIMLQQLLVRHELSFGWSMRIVGFTLLPLLVVSCLTVVEPPAPNPTPSAVEASETSSPETGSGTALQDKEESAASKSRIMDFAVLKNRTYVVLCVGLAIALLGWFTPIFYISAYAIEKGQSPSTAFYLVSALNAASCFGRVGPGYVADTLGHFNVLAIVTLLSGVISFCWTRATSLAALIIWSLAYGFASGAVVSLQNACAGKVASHGTQGTAVGFLNACIAFSALIGTPISGIILKSSGYLALSVWSGATLCGGAVVIAAARFLQNKDLNVAF